MSLPILLRRIFNRQRILMLAATVVMVLSMPGSIVAAINQQPTIYDHVDQLHSFQHEYHIASSVDHYVLSTVYRIGMINKGEEKKFRKLSSSTTASIESMTNIGSDDSEVSDGSPVLIRHQLPQSIQESRMKDLRERRLNTRSLQISLPVDPLDPLVSTASTERERVRSLANMNRVIYPATDYSKYMDKLQSVYESNLNIMGGVGESAIERAESETSLNSVWKSTMEGFVSSDDSNSNGKSWNEEINPDTTTSNVLNTDGVGVAMAVYISSLTNEAVLVFRGSHSQSDYNNMLLWHEGWFLERMKQQILDNWQTATLEDPSLNDEFERRRLSNDFSDKVSFFGITQALLVKQDLTWLSLGLSDSYSLINQGYWPLTKELVNNALTTIGTGKSIYLTGHSQGGARASLVSMWLEKSSTTYCPSSKCPTYTFSGVGTQCAVRYSLPSDYANDVDVTILHSQITQYVHALDTFGLMDYQNGRVCKYGANDLRNNDGSSDGKSKDYSSVKHFCGKIVGYSGSQLMMPTNQAESDFSACRYFTHWSGSVTKWLSDDTVLNADGSTDGGCSNEILIPTNDPNQQCAPCRTTRCLASESKKLPNLALNWKNSVINSKTNTIQKHPCIIDGPSSAIPSIVTKVSLTGALTQNGKFQSCIFLGGKQDYLLTGSGDSNNGGPGVAGNEKSFNIAFRSANTMMDAQLQATLFIKDTTGVDNIMKKQVVLAYTTRGDNSEDNDNSSAPSTNLINAEFTKDTRYCGIVKHIIKICITVVESDTNPSTELDAYVSVGFTESGNKLVKLIAKGAVTALTGYSSVTNSDTSTDVTNLLLAMPESALSLKVATLQQGSGVIIHNDAGLIDRSNTVINNKLNAATTTLANQNAIVENAVKEKIAITSDHMCLSGVANPTDAQKTRGAIIDKSENQDGSDRCIVLGSESAAKVQMIPVSSGYNHPSTEEATNCFETVKQRILQAGANVLDTQLLDHMLTELKLKDLPSIQQTISDMKQTNIIDWLDQVKSCAAANPVLSEFVCHAIDNPSVQPNVASLSSDKLNKDIKDAVHYSLLLDKLTYAISFTSTGGTGILKDIVDKLVSERPNDWKSYFNAFEIAKTLTMQTVVDSYTIPEASDWSSTNEKRKRWKSCCTSTHGTAALRINILEAVLEDHRLGFPFNADAGMALTVVPSKEVSTTQFHKHLYETWNLAFVSHYDESPYFYAKLLAPAVTCAEPDEFLFHRSMALYLHIHAVLFNRIAVQSGNEPLYEATNWNNPELTTKWGKINKATTDPWLVSESLGTTFTQAGHSGIKIDIVNKVAGRYISSTVVGSLASGLSGLEMKVSKDLGKTSESVPLEKDNVNCINAGNVGGLEVCFKEGEYGPNSRVLQSTNGNPAPLQIPSKTKVIAFLRPQNLANQVEYDSPALEMFDLDTPHPCLTRPFGTPETDNWTVSTFVNAADEVKSCTVLGEGSFMNLDSKCSSLTSCSINAEVAISDETAARILKENSESTRRNLNEDSDNVIEDVLDNIEFDNESDTDTVSSDLHKRALSSSNSLAQKLQLKFTKSANVLQKDVRVQLLLNGYRLMDVDLLKQTKQCISAPGIIDVCVERSSEGITLPNGWSISSTFGSRQLESLDEEESKSESEFPRRQLQQSQTVVGIAITMLGIKKVIPLAALDSSDNSMKITQGSWTTLSSNEGFDATVSAQIHDECRDIICPAGTSCSAGAVGQESCFPDLWSTPNGDSKSMIQQLVRLAASPYTNSFSEQYKEDGWSTYKRFCLSHHHEFPTALELDDRHDCAIISKKTFLGSAVPVCSISFEGSDDNFEAIEPAYKTGTTVINGFEVWRGLAREYSRFLSHPEWNQWVNMANDPNQCKQIYITGHSQGAGVAVLHRLHMEFGKLVTFAVPAVFAPYSHPPYCFGDSFHLQEDIVKAFPLGFKLGGLREYSMCSNSDEILNSDNNDNLNIEYHGCNSNFVGETNFCDFYSHHGVGNYRNKIDSITNNGLGNTGSPTYSMCTKKVPGHWIEECVSQKCSIGDSLCSMGPEALRASLTYENSRAIAINQVKLGSLPAGKIMSSSGRVDMGDLSSTKFSVPNVKTDDLLAKNGNLCHPKILEKYANGAENVNVGAFAKPGDYSQCVALTETSFFIVRGVEQSDPSTQQIQLDLFKDVLATDDAETKNPEISIVMHMTVLLPEDPSVIISVWPLSQPLLRVDYKLAPSNILCQSIDGNTEGCVVYTETDANTNQYTLDFILFMDNDIAYKTNIANIDGSAIPVPIMTLTKSPKITTEFGSLATKYLQSSSSNPVAYQEVSSPLIDATSTSPDGSKGVCIKVIPGSFCSPTDINNPTTTGQCDAFRNAVCSTGGLCTCPADSCASEQGICVSKDSPDAYRSVGHPCVGNAGDDFEMFRLKKDPSFGAPYERCIVLGESSYLRLDYPSPDEVRKSPTDVTIKSRVKVAFSAVPFGIHREIMSQLKLVAPPTPRRSLQSGAVAQSIIPQLSASLSEINKALPSAIQKSNQIVGKLVSLTGGKDEACALVSASTLRKIPIADLCLKVAAAEGNDGTGTTTTTVTTSRRLLSTGETETTTTEDNNKVRVSFCVPALFNRCYSIPIATIKKKTKTISNSTPVGSGRRLQGSSDSDDTVTESYEISPDVPDENSYMVEEEPPSNVQQKQNDAVIVSPSITVFLFVLLFLIVLTFLNYVVTTNFFNQHIAPICFYLRNCRNTEAGDINDLNIHTHARSRQGHRLSAQSITDISGNDVSNYNDDTSENRPSPIQLARKENPELFRRFNDNSTGYSYSSIVFHCASWIPQNPKLRLLLGNSVYAHFGRVFFRNNQVIQLPLFPDEKYWSDSKTTPTIRSFLAFRRSVLVCFFFLSAIIIGMGIVQDGVNVVYDLINVEEESNKDLEHGDVVSLMGLFRSVGGGQSVVSPSSQNAGDSETTGSVGNRMRRRLFRVDGEVLSMSNERDYEDLHHNGNFDSNIMDYNTMNRMERLEAINLLASAGSWSGLMKKLRESSSQQSLQSSDSTNLRLLTLPRELQDTLLQDGNVDPNATSIDSNAASRQDYNIEQAFEVRRRLKIFYTIFYLVKLFISGLTCFSAAKALHTWTEYKSSTRWTIFAFVTRVCITLTVSIIPWYFLFFQAQTDTSGVTTNASFSAEDSRPESLNTAARLFMDILLNLPILSLSITCSPGLISGSLLVLELLPFTIIPHMLIFVFPLVSLISLWPMLSLLGHGLANWKILYGSLIFLGYGVLVSMAAFSALHSLEAFRLLGKKAVGNTSNSNSPVGKNNNGNRDRDYKENPNKSNQLGNSNGNQVKNQNFLTNGPTLLTNQNGHNVGNETSPKSDIKKEAIVPRRGKRDSAVNTNNNNNNMVMNSGNHNGVTGPIGLSHGIHTTNIIPVSSNAAIVPKSSYSDSNNSDQDNNDTKSKRQRSPTSSFTAARRGSGQAVSDISKWVLRKISSTEDVTSGEKNSGLNDNLDDVHAVTITDNHNNSSVDKFNKNLNQSNNTTNLNNNRLSTVSISNKTSDATFDPSSSTTSTSLNINSNVALFESASKATSGVGSTFRGSSRASIELKEAVVQGTLISHLHAKMNPRVTSVLWYAKKLYIGGIILILWGVFDQSGDLHDFLNGLINYSNYNLSNGLVSLILTTIIECVVNKLMIMVVMSDLVIIGLIRLRSYNGYMADDVVLSSFCLLWGFGDQINLEFNKGVKTELVRQASIEAENNNTRKNDDDDDDDDDFLNSPRGAVAEIGNFVSRKISSRSSMISNADILVASSSQGISNASKKLQNIIATKVLSNKSPNVNNSVNPGPGANRVRTKSMPPIQMKQDGSEGGVQDLAKRHREFLAQQANAKLQEEIKTAIANEDKNKNSIEKDFSDKSSDIVSDGSVHDINKPNNVQIEEEDFERDDVSEKIKNNTSNSKNNSKTSNSNPANGTNNVTNTNNTLGLSLNSTNAPTSFQVVGIPTTQIGSPTNGSGLTTQQDSSLGGPTIVSSPNNCTIVVNHIVQNGQNGQNTTPSQTETVTPRKESSLNGTNNLNQIPGAVRNGSKLTNNSGSKNATNISNSNQSTCSNFNAATVGGLAGDTMSPTAISTPQNERNE